MEGGKGWLVGHLALLLGEWKIKVLFQIFLEVLEEIWHSINLLGGTVLCVNDQRRIDPAGR